MSTDILKNVCNVLNSYLFQNVWNEPYTETRLNVKPTRIQSRSCTGAFIVRNTNIELPEAKVPFNTYAIVKSSLGIINLDFDGWKDLAELNDEFKVLLNVHGSEGHMLHKGSIYVMNDSNSIYLYMVINNNMAMKFMGKTYDMSDIHITSYVYGKRYSKRIVHSGKVPDGTDTRLTYITQLKTVGDSITNPLLYVNGYRVDYQYVDSIKKNDYIDLIDDPEVFAEFNVDLTLEEYDNVFYSEQDSIDKYLIHIPKELNPSNWVITKNTIDMYLNTKPMDDSNPKGLYVHQCQVDLPTINNVTHNDFSLPVYIVDAYKDSLNTQYVTLTVRCRRHNNDNVLVPDKSYINMLYSEKHDDSTIIAHLMGKIDGTNLSFWKASNIEQTAYINTMFDVVQRVDETNLASYVDILGFYHTLSIICQRITRTVVDDWFYGVKTMTKPYVYQNEYVSPLVYRNGYLVPFDQVGLIDNGEDTFSIDLDEATNYEVGDELIIETFLTGDETAYTFTPSEDANSITIKYSDFTLYERVSMVENPVKGINGTFDYVYQEVTDFRGKIVVETADDDSTTITFTTNLFGTTYIIQKNEFVKTYSRNIDQELIDTKIITTDMAMFDIDSNEIPILTLEHARVFLNNKMLIKGLDYEMVTLTNTAGLIAIRQIVLYNASYIKTSDNILAVVLHGETVEDTTNGFMLGSVVDREDPTTIWYDNISMLNIEGKAIRDVNIAGDGYLVADEEYRVGAPYGMETCIPDRVRDFIENYHSNDDIERITIIGKYFDSIHTDTTDNVIISKSHNVISIMTNAIIRDILAGTDQIGYDPDDALMLANLSEYDYLKPYDIVVQNNVNLDFVDIYPAYTQKTLPNLDKYLLLERVKSVLFPTDPVKDGD